MDLFMSEHVKRESNVCATRDYLQRKISKLPPSEQGKAVQGLRASTGYILGLRMMNAQTADQVSDAMAWYADMILAIFEVERAEFANRAGSIVESMISGH
jgi:hypothetical protein